MKARSEHETVQNRRKQLGNVKNANKNLVKLHFTAICKKLCCENFPLYSSSPVSMDHIGSRDAYTEEPLYPGHLETRRDCPDCKVSSFWGLKMYYGKA